MLERCCWCGKAITDNTPAYGMTAKFRKVVDTPPVEKEAYIIDIPVHKSMDSADCVSVWAIVAGKSSDVKKAGNDLIFMLCSKKCGHELKEILRAEISFIDSVMKQGL